MVLLNSKPPSVASVTFSPIDDSLNSLEAGEGGDEISDEELTERFITPYLNVEAEESMVIKRNHLVTMRDDNGVSLEFMVTHVELESAGDEEEGMYTQFTQID